MQLAMIALAAVVIVVAYGQLLLIERVSPVGRPDPVPAPPEEPLSPSIQEYL